MRIRSAASAVLLLALTTLVAGILVAAEPAADWPVYGNDAGHMRFSPLTQITPDNVGRLQQAWVYRMRPPGVQMVVGTMFGGRGAAQGSAEAGSSAPAIPRRRFAQSEVTPLMIDGVLYFGIPYGRIVALDATSGAERWSAAAQASTRGVAYWPGDATHPPAIVYASGTSLGVLDARTGKPVSGFGTDGVLKGATGTAGAATSPPLLYRNLIVSQAANPNGDGRNGDVRAFDVTTGRQVWRFATIPEPGTKFADTWPAGGTVGRRGALVWGLMTVDVARGIVFFPVNAPQWDRYGGDRHGSNLFGSSIVALDAATGKYRWHFQIVHHDIWDFDPGAAPMLIDVRRNGRTIPAVALISKSGLMFLLDRTNGKPIYGVEERPVPASDVPGEKAWPTQPFPVKPAPLARQSMSLADVATVTPELEAYCRDLIARNNIGMGGPYLPPGYNRPTVNFPGTIGSANWGGMSFNPALGFAFVNTQDIGQITGIGARDSAPRQTIGVAGVGSAGMPAIPYDMIGLAGRFKEPKSNLLCQQPPWGSLTAVNVNTGEIAWTVPLGVTDSLPADRQRTGRPNLGGSIATAGGLVFIGATDDGRFRAFDARNGRELWTVKLDAPNHSVPISYLGGDGRQFVVLPATGGGFLEDPAADDALVAFALPAAAPQARPTGAGAGLPLQAGGDPAPAPLLFREHWNGLPMAQPITHEHLANQQLALHLHGDAAAIRKSQHPTENYLYTGESVTNWGLTVSDPAALWDLTGNARIRLKTRNSGYRLLHVMLKTADGKWYVSEEGNGESTAWIEMDYIPRDLHWRELVMEDRPTNASNRRQPDAARQPLVAAAVARPDLTQVEQIGFTDLMPGGWIPSSSRVAGFEVYGRRIPR